MAKRLRSVLISTALLAAAAVGVQTPPAAADTAPGGPGSLSHFDLARKDCLGTARNTTSKIWYTVANGVLSDVYAPTIDTTNVETMQYLVTDGSSFTDLQTRDTTYTVKADPTGMTCTVTSTARSGAYRLITTYVTDPARASVVLHTTYVPLKPAARDYRLYVRLDPTVGGNGGGGADNAGADSATIDTSTGSPVPVSFDTVTQTNAANRDYAVPSYLALRADRPFPQASSGFVGTDGDRLTQLDSTHTLTTHTDATGGNVEQTARVQLDRSGTTTLALGFGTTQAAAVATAGASVRTPFPALAAKYQAQWRSYDAHLRPASRHIAGLSRAQQKLAQQTYVTSANVLKASEDKTFPGAIVASLASPWGQAVSAGDPNNTYWGSYREVFARDLYEAFTGLLTDGDLATAQAATRFLLLHQQQADGSLPRNSLVNGKPAPDTFNVQLDEVAYPILMVSQAGLSRDRQLWPHVQAAANYLISHGPAAGPERWEEQSGYSPSTIAAEIAGLVAAGDIADQHGADAAARLYRATADQYQRSIKSWTVTTNGPLSEKPYFIRISKSGDPNAAISYNLNNGGPTLDQRSIVDAGFLELVRLGELPANDKDVLNSLPVVDATLAKNTPSGTGFLRYNGDGYGDCHVGAGTSCTTEGTPWAPSGVGTGHVWPVLAAERGENDLALGHVATAGTRLASVDAMASGVGLVPEQAWDAPDVAASPYGTDPSAASIGFEDGQAAGSAAPLTWGAAAQVRLVADLSAGRTLEQPAATTARYVRHRQGTTPLTVTSPVDQTAVTGSTIHVAGTAAPGATVDIGDVATDGNSATTVTSVRAGRDGSFAADVTAATGTNVIVVSSTARDGGTAQAVRTVVNDVVAGTLVYQTTDPTGDDNGPGNYAYPTAADFHAGAYDLTGLQVYDTGDTVTFRVQTRDLTPTFGSDLGAQLIDVYAHAPGVTPTSTAAAFPGRNYSIAPAFAWNRLIEVQGFGQRFVDASGTTLGTVAIKANAVSRYITFAVPKAALGGTPGSGWTFAITLAGQDGYSPDQARAFAATPQPYNFGVCADGASGPACSVDPATVPKVMDTFTDPAELDYLNGPVAITGLTLP